MAAVEAEYLTVAEAAALLRVAPSTIRRWIREGDLPAYRLGRRRVGLKQDELAKLVTPARPQTSDQGKKEQTGIPKLTPEEVQRGLEAMDRAERHAKELQAQRGGKLFPPSWVTLAELRDERTRELS